MFTMTTEEADKHWHYRADGKNLLWFFKDTATSDGYTDTSGTYKYYLECTNGIFTDNHVTSPSLANTDLPKMYLFERSTPVTGVTVEPTSKAIAVGEETQLTATVTPEDASIKTVTWSSSNTSVATVDSTGKVTGVSAGTATITVTTTDGGKTATCEITVGEVAVTGITLDKESALVEVGRTVQLTATVTPENVTNKNVIWTSSNENVARVVNGEVTGYEEGTVTITAITEDGGKTATCSVTVTAPVIRPGYVIVIDGYALSTEPETDYHTEGTNGANHYYGLKGVAYDGEEEPAENILWTLTEVEGSDGTAYYIQSLDGRYLNATYKSDEPIVGRLNLDDTPDIWHLDGDIEDWIVSGSYLQSTNATTDSKELCLAYETVGSSNNRIDLFTIRSRANADSSSLESPDITAEVSYEETDTFKDGGEYIIAATTAADDSKVYAVKNNGTTSANTVSVILDVVTNGSETPYIITDDIGVPWKYTSSNQYMTNRSLYLSYSNNVPRASSSTGRAISYTGGNLRFARSTAGSYLLSNLQHLKRNIWNKLHRHRKHPYL